MLGIRRLNRAACAALACALALGGCAGTPVAVVKPPATTRTDWSYGPKLGNLRDQRENAMRENWVGRTRAELVAHFGPPKTTAGIPGRREPPVAVMIYRGRDPHSGCVDAFVVRVDATQEVSDYICR